jgi:dihydroorotase
MKETMIDKTRLESKSRNTPFDGWKLKGTAVMTIVGGRIVFPFDHKYHTSSLGAG